MLWCRGMPIGPKWAACREVYNNIFFNMIEYLHKQIVTPEETALDAQHMEARSEQVEWQSCLVEKWFEPRIGRISWWNLINILSEEGRRRAVVDGWSFGSLSECRLLTQGMMSIQVVEVNNNFLSQPFSYLNALIPSRYTLRGLSIACSNFHL